MASVIRHTADDVGGVKLDLNVVPLAGDDDVRGDAAQLGADVFIKGRATRLVLTLPNDGVVRRHGSCQVDAFDQGVVDELGADVGPAVHKLDESRADQRLQGHAQQWSDVFVDWIHLAHDDPTLDDEDVEDVHESQRVLISRTCRTSEARRASERVRARERTSVEVNTHRARVQRPALCAPRCIASPIPA